MNATVRNASIAATIALTIASTLSPGTASARGAKSHAAAAAAAAPPPAFGYYYGEFPIQLDYAQAQALSLRQPYYRHFLYDYCDYRNCWLRWDGTAWVPSWYGPIN